MADILPFTRKNPAHKATEPKTQAPETPTVKTSEPPTKAPQPLGLADLDKLLDCIVLMRDMRKRCAPENPVESLLSVAAQTAYMAIEKLEKELKIGEQE